MKVEMIAIGDELLLGQTVNTNAAWIGDACEQVGWRLERVVTIGDGIDGICAAIAQAEAHADLLIITGGLGPTRDDRTKHALCAHYGVELVCDEAWAQHMAERFASVGLQIIQSNQDQALIPAGAIALPNPRGTAQGIWFDRLAVGGSGIAGATVALPGVPFEMKGLFKDEVIPRLKAAGACDNQSLPLRMHRKILTMGQGESLLADSISDWEDGLSDCDLSLAYLPSPAQVFLRLTATGTDPDETRQRLDCAADELLAQISSVVVSAQGRTVEHEAAHQLLLLNQTIAVAESCTGGGLGADLVSLPGASAYYLGSVVAYANSVKTSQLDVSADLLEAHGAVSEPVARAMAEGVRRRLKSDWSIAVTGIAGPTGGSSEKPVGTVYIACSGPHGTVVNRYQWGRSRARNLLRTRRTALALLISKLKDLQIA
jgi:nicotinamide-nucleotide amidase